MIVVGTGGLIEAVTRAALDYQELLERRQATQRFNELVSAQEPIEAAALRERQRRAREEKEGVRDCLRSMWFDSQIGVDLCPECDGGGWVQVYSQHPPAFGVCEKCFNPGDYESP